MSNRNDLEHGVVGIVAMTAAFIFVVALVVFEQTSAALKERVECHRIVHQTDERIPQHCLTTDRK